MTDKCTYEQIENKVEYDYADYLASWKDEIKRKEIPEQNVSFPFKRKHRRVSNKHAGHKQ